MSDSVAVGILFYVLSIGVTIQIYLELLHSKNLTSGEFNRFFYLVVVPLIPVVNIITAIYFVILENNRKDNDGE